MNAQLKKVLSLFDKANTAYINCDGNMCSECEYNNIEAHKEPCNQCFFNSWNRFEPKKEQVERESRKPKGRK